MASLDTMRNANPQSLLISVLLMTFSFSQMVSCALSKEFSQSSINLQLTPVLQPVSRKPPSCLRVCLKTKSTLLELPRALLMVLYQSGILASPSVPRSSPSIIVLLSSNTSKTKLTLGVLAPSHSLDGSFYSTL